MHYLFTLFFLLAVVQGATTKEVKEAETSIMVLLSPLFPGAAHKSPTKGKFKVDKCEKHKINWTEVLLMQKDVALKYSFKDGCDIEGTIRPKILQEFSARLNLRHLENYTSIESMNKITAGLEKIPVLFLAMRSGVLSGNKGTVKFEADYQVKINPMNGKVEENPGGEIRISEIYGKKVNFKKKVIVK